jgi:UDP-N-acetylglucosamine 2-epimerase (non-hydrolysing)
MALNKQRHFAVVLGARPNFIKAAPFFREAKKHPEFKFTTIHTGQHFDENMSKLFFREMNIPKPDIFLNVRGEFHTEKIGKMFNKLNNILTNKKFDKIIVFGDVNSTLAGAITAAKNNCKLVHIEAGLRSHDRRMPEEINRVIVDHISDLLFTTEPSANRNLIKEGIDRSKIKYVGNIMIESMEFFQEQINNSKIMNKLKLNRKQYAVNTIHRQENTDSRYALEKILIFLNKLSNDISIIFPLHPGTKKKIAEYKLNNFLKKLIVTEPLGYFDFTKLLINSKGVVTDSGGIQEETTHLGVPCCTLRDTTERPITLTLGSNKLFLIDSIDIKEVKKHLNSKFKSRHIPLWDSKVSERIFKRL